MNRQGNPSEYIHDILEAASNAEAFVIGMEFEAFEADTKSVYAVIRALEIIGEATKHLPNELRDRYPAIPWRDMAGMRDVMIHEYAKVNLFRVFETVRKDLPGLRSALTQILADLEASRDQ